MGELQKRIKECWKDMAVINEQGVPIAFVGDLAKIQQNFLDIAEEMRKEFPDFGMTNLVVSKFEIEAQKWYVKWLK